MRFIAMISDLLFHSSIHEFCMKILDQLPVKWLKRYTFLCHEMKLSLILLHNPMAFHIASHLVSVEPNSCESSQLAFTFAISEKKEIANQVNGKLIQNMMKKKAQSRASCSVAEQEI